MKKLFTLIFSCAFFLSLMSGISFAYQGALPEIYISDVKLEKEVYNIGETVKGTFEIRNYDEVVASNIYYEVHLVGDYEHTIANTFYSHSSMFGPNVLGAKERKTIAFEYKLPETLSGKGLGIQIQSMLQTGSNLGWGDAFLEITGTSKFITNQNSEISTSASDTKTYFLQSGPMVYKGEKAYLTTEFNSKLAVSTDIYPKLTIYDRSEARETLLTRDETVINAKAKAITKAKIELPTFDYTPRVYVGKLDFYNKAGQQVSETLNFRYIIYGQMVTINNITADKEYGKAGDIVSLLVDITGAPFDINDPEVVASSTGSIAVKLTNETGKIVGENLETEVDFNSDNIRTYPIQLSGKAKTLTAEISVTGTDGSLLGKQTVNLTTTPMQETIWSLALDYINHPVVIYILIAIIILLSLWAIYCLAKSKNILAIILLIILVTLVVGWFWMSTMKKVEAWTMETQEIWDDRHDRTTKFFVNYPQPDQIFSPEQKINVQIKVTVSACGNGGTQTGYFDIWNNDDISNVVSASSSVKSSDSFTLVIPDFLLSLVVGENKLYAEWFLTGNANKGAGNSTARGYQPYIIAESCTDGIQNQDETGIDCGGSCPNACLGVTCSRTPDARNIEKGTPVTFTANATGGVKPYTYYWKLESCTSGLGKWSFPSCYSTYLNKSDINTSTVSDTSSLVYNFDGLTGSRSYYNATISILDNSGNRIASSCGSNIKVVDTVNCSNGIQDTDETGIDCGGPCPACPVVTPPATCSDNIQNQGETGIDCGGPCPTACVDDGDTTDGDGTDVDDGDDGIGDAATSTCIISQTLPDNNGTIKKDMNTSWSVDLDPACDTCTIKWSVKDSYSTNSSLLQTGSATTLTDYPFGAVGENILYVDVKDNSGAQICDSNKTVNILPKEGTINEI